MNATRRSFILSAPFAGAIAFGQEWKKDGEDTAIILFEGSTPEEFGVGVRTPLRADWIRVEVFYEATAYFESGTKKLMLSRESLAPVAGNEGYGATNQNFLIPRAAVRFVRLTFLNEVAKREIPAPAPKA